MREDRRGAFQALIHNKWFGLISPASHGLTRVNFSAKNSYASSKILSISSLLSNLRIYSFAPNCLILKQVKAFLRKNSCTTSMLCTSSKTLTATLGTQSLISEEVIYKQQSIIFNIFLSQSRLFVFFFKFTCFVRKAPVNCSFFVLQQFWSCRSGRDARWK